MIRLGDGRVWVPQTKGDVRRPDQIPEAERDYYLDRRYPSFGNLAPRHISSRAAKLVCDSGRGVGPGARGVYLDFADAIKRLGHKTIEERYGNLLAMYGKITDENPYEVPMRIYPAPHYTMGGLWMDYSLMSTVPGLFVIGEANFSDHGANRLGASAQMQGLADGYFVLPPTLGDWLAQAGPSSASTGTAAFTATVQQVNEFNAKLLAVRGQRSPESLHRELGNIMWNKCGMGRTAAGLQEAMREIKDLRGRFWQELRVTGDGASGHPIVRCHGEFDAAVF